jgi:hypothetical protein
VRPCLATVFEQIVCGRQKVLIPGAVAVFPEGKSLAQVIQVDAEKDS